MRLSVYSIWTRVNSLDPLLVRVKPNIINKCNCMQEARCLQSKRSKKKTKTKGFLGNTGQNNSRITFIASASRSLPGTEGRSSHKGVKKSEDDDPVMTVIEWVCKQLFQRVFQTKIQPSMKLCA